MIVLQYWLDFCHTSQNLLSWCKYVFLYITPIKISPFTRCLYLFLLSKLLPSLDLSFFCLFWWLFATPWIYSPRNSPGKNTGVGSLSLLQEIFPTQGLSPDLLHCRQILYQLNHQGSPRILEWVAYPFSSGSSQPRNWAGVSCIVGRFFTNWAIRETLYFGCTLQFAGS